MQVLNTAEEDNELHAGQPLGEFHFLSSDNTILTTQFCILSVPCAIAPLVSIDNSNMSTSQVQSLAELQGL